MARKIFKLDNLTSDNRIIVSSKKLAIDFSRESTQVLVYFDDLSMPSYDICVELYIYNNNQKFATSFELPIKGKNAAIVIESFTDYDIELIIVQKV